MQKLILALLFVSILAISACTTQSTGPTITPFVGGKNGLIMEFGAQSPPREVFDNGQFPFAVVVQLDNRGEYDIQSNDGYIEIIGINAETFGVRDADLIQDIPAIDGARRRPDGSVTQGMRDVVTFNNLNYQENIPGSLQNTIRASACYNYETRTSTNICIKRETIDGVTTNEICKIGEEKRVYNSGAPIHITRLVQTPRGNDGILVVFTIEHVGAPNDRFYRTDTQCDSRINNPQIYSVYVEVDPIINRRVRANCTGWQDGSGDSGYVTLFSRNPRTITCSFDLQGVQNDFVEPLNINLRYRYQQFIETPIIIRDVSTN